MPSPTRSTAHPRTALQPAFLQAATRLKAVLLAAPLLFPGAAVLAQAPACPAVEPHTPTPADVAYSHGHYDDAEGLYRQAFTQQPQSADLSAALVRTLLREGMISQAAAQASTGLEANPHAAPALTAVAEVQLRQGHPWLAQQTLDAAIAAEPCYPRAHLIRSRVLRINSMYSSERAEIQRAYDIDPDDPDIQRAWLTIGSPAHDVEGTAAALATMKDLDEETRKKAEATMHGILPMLSENSQTCKVLPADASAVIALQPSFADVKHVDGYRLEAQLPKSRAKLIVDTSASGLYISQALATLNGFEQGVGDPAGTVRVDSVRVGPLEFHDCLVGVSATPFAAGADGFIGTDIFAQWLITLDFRVAKMTLSPLPQVAGVLPGDRPAAPDSGDWTQAYHRRQYLLLPITFGNKSRELFVLASGMRFSAMRSDTAHSLSKMTVNFTNTEQTTTGGKIQFYREVFDMQMADLPQIHQGHILELDPSVMDRNAGFRVAGMLGLDVLHDYTLSLDYRDGLVKLVPIEAGATPAARNTMIASATQEPNLIEPVCATADTTPRPINQTIQARITGTIDSAHLKPGKEVFAKVVYGLAYPGCRLDEDAIVYGRVTAASSTKDPAASELSLVFDRADCAGQAKKLLHLRLIGLVAPEDTTRHLHEDLPTEVAGGARSVQTAIAGLVNAGDEELDPGGPPHTVRPGIVVNMPQVKLEPEAGPACSTKISSTNHSIQLGTGSQLILTMLGAE